MSDLVETKLHQKFRERNIMGCPAAGAGALIGQAGAAAVARWRDKKAKDCDQTPSSHSHTWPGQAGDSTYITHVT